MPPNSEPLLGGFGQPARALFFLGTQKAPTGRLLEESLSSRQPPFKLRLLSVSVSSPVSV